MKNLLILSFISLATLTLAQPANDNCTSATVLTIDNQDCSGTTQNATLEGSECYTNYGAGSTEHSTWYRVTALNDSLVFSVAQTNATNCASPHVSIYGPYTPGGGCQPACSEQIYDELHNGDPGVHVLQTGLSVGSDYLIQVVDLDCGGPNDGHVEYCIGVFNPVLNNTIGGAEGIDQCGVTYSGTNIGYYPTNGGVGLENLDGNAGTTCPTCTAGDDVSYIVNNDSWFYFCATTAGDWSVDFNNITNCTNASNADGLQMTIFTGTPTSLTQVWNSANPSQPGSSQTSPSFPVTAGQCVYLVVDGFAGDQCDYSYTLNNLTAPCDLLPLPTELSNFIVYNAGNKNILRWKTLSEANSDYFTLERSIDGISWEFIESIPASGNSIETLSYLYEDDQFRNSMNYYRLSQYDVDATESWSIIRAIDNSQSNPSILKTINLIGQEVDDLYTGCVIVIYSNGTTERVYR